MVPTTHVLSAVSETDGDSAQQPGSRIPTMIVISYISINQQAFPPGKLTDL